MESIKDLQQRISQKFDEFVVKEIVKKQTSCDDFDIIKINLGSPAIKGDSYLSEVTRFSIEATNVRSKENLTVNVIVKAYPKSLVRRKTFRTLDFFKTEVTFYEEIWPKLEAFQNSKNIQEKVDNVPKILAYHIDSDDGFIAMDDLTFKSFSTCPRDVPLDLEHVEVLLKLFARIHALGIVYRQENEEEFQKMANVLHENYFSEDLRPWIGKFYKNIQKVVKDAVKKELDEVYYEKICQEFDKDIYGEMVKLCADHTSPLVTLTHGDPWIPNFLFQYDTNLRPSYVKLIDYQLSRIVPLALDLLFFIYGCTSPSLRESHFPEMLSSYLSAFNHFSVQLGSTTDQLTMDQLRAELKRCYAFGLGICSEANVMTLLDEDEAFDLEAMIQRDGDEVIRVEDVFVVKNIQDKLKRQRVAGFVKDMIDEGFV